MSSDLMSAIGWLLSHSWHILTQITIPGTNIHFAALLVGLFLARLGLRLLLMMMGISVGYTDVLNGVRVRDTFSKKKG